MSQKSFSEKNNRAQELIDLDDLDYMRGSKAALLLQTPRGGKLLVLFTAITIFFCLLWAWWAKVDEITRGHGQIIPSSRLQLIQNLEGGIIENILVREGDLVEIDQILLELDDTQFSSSFNERIVEYYSLLATVTRLQAETQNSALVFPDELKNYSEAKKQESNIYQSRRQALNNELAMLDEQERQHSQELKALQARYKNVKKGYQLGLKELKITKPMAAKGVVSEVELIQLEQRVNELLTNLEEAEISIPKLAAALKESQGKIQEVILKFQQNSLSELKKAELRLAQLKEVKRALKDQVIRRAVRSPVAGIIKKIHVNTVGGVISPGMDLMEIVPVNDNLQVEAEVSPKDIAFLRPGLDVVVKLTAYDYSIYGGLKGKLAHISADTIIKEDGQPVYLVKVETTQSYLGTADKPLEIIPGMRASVDILTGKKRVLDYLLKPVLKAKQNALTER